MYVCSFLIINYIKFTFYHHQIVGFLQNCLQLYEKKPFLLMLWEKHYKETLEYLVMEFQVATFVYDPFKLPPLTSAVAN